MDLITIFKANVTSLGPMSNGAKSTQTAFLLAVGNFEMIQETKPSVYSADPTLTIFVFDVLTIGGAKLSSGISCGIIFGSDRSPRC